MYMQVPLASNLFLYPVKSNSLHHLGGCSPALTAVLDSSCSEQYDSQETNLHMGSLSSQNATICVA